MGSYTSVDRTSIQETRCETHNEVFELLCLKHDQLLCLTCFENNSSCKDVVELTKFVAGIKDSEILREAETGLSESIDNMATIIKVLKENQDRADCENDHTKREVDKFCDSIVNQIRNAQENMKAEIDEYTKGMKSATLESLKNLQNNQAKTAELQAQLESMKINSSEIQIYKVFREIITKTQKNDEHIKKLIDTGKTDTLHISLATNDTVKLILENKQLAAINTKKVQANIYLKNSKEKQAQIIQPRTQSLFNDIKISLATSFTYRSGYLSGLSVLPNGKILICDHSGRNPIAVVDESGKLLSTIPVSWRAVFDVAVIDEYTVAVTSAYNKVVSIAHIPSSNIKRSITTNSWCYGIAYSDQHLYCCVCKEGIIKMSVNTGKSLLLYRSDLSGHSYITNHNNKLFFTDFDKGTVTCCDMEGKKVWKFENSSELVSPHGIAVNIIGNIFVNGLYDNSVVMLSEDGKRSRPVLTDVDNLKEPKALFFDAIRNRFLVGNENGDVFIYNVA